MLRRCLFAVSLMLITGFCGVTESGESVVRKTVESKNGVICADDIAAALLDVANYNGDAVKSFWPGNSTVNLNSAKTRWGIIGANAAMPPGLGLLIRRDEQGARVLIIEVDREKLQRSNRTIKRVIRSQLSDDESTNDYGLVFDAQDDRLESASTVCVLIHGYNATPASLASLHQAIEDAGLVAVHFTYPNDGPIADSAKLLRAELARLSQLAPDASVALVTHSMGGLVARAAIECDRPAANVSQLVMIAPPNHGSNLARLPMTLDFWEHFVRSKDRSCEEFIRQSASDGFCEARTDLTPGSPFLSQLNRRDRNPDVRYSIFLGTNGRFSQPEQDRLHRSWMSLCDRNKAASLLSPRVEPLWQGSELTNGAGDGAVSLESGQLDGVEDVNVMPFSHDLFKGQSGQEARRQVVEALLNRLGASAE